MNLNRRHKLTNEEIEHVKRITNSGKLYYDYDPLIESARNCAYETCRRYSRHEAGIDELRPLFKELGKNPGIAEGFITEFGFNLSIGDDFDAGCGLKIIDCNEVSIGNNVTIGENVGIYTSNHAEDPGLRRDHWCSELPVRIGNNVVIESNSVVLPGAIIEDDAWIRPGSVVLGRIEADSICAGDPARRENK
ncbi:DapH/DapD/GlmU-related protein [Ligilactobacillus sp.]|uniref:DapH/DapD/GlmU-related protein n=1 Tax=Ligilactobacillus sp. TaxID=2767921 RepID=UPI002FE1F311